MDSKEQEQEQECDEPQANEFKDKKARRSSILKIPKQNTELVAYKRVSFASSSLIKPFAADPEHNTLWDSTYEEEIDATDSLKASTSKNPEVDLINTNELFEDKNEIQLHERKTTIEVMTRKSVALKDLVMDKENIFLSVTNLPLNASCASEMELTNLDVMENASLIKNNNFKTKLFSSSMELTGDSSLATNVVYAEKLAVLNSSTDEMESTLTLLKPIDDNKEDIDILTCSETANTGRTGAQKTNSTRIFHGFQEASNMELTSNLVVNKTEYDKPVVDDVDMEYTSNLLVNNIHETKFAKTVIDDVDMEFTSNLALADQAKLNATSDMEFTSNLLVDNAHETKFAKTVIDDVDMEFTSNLALVDQAKLIGIIGNNTINPPSNQSKMSLIEFAKNKRICQDKQSKTVVEDQDMEYTTNLPVVDKNMIIEQANILSKSANISAVDMEFTSNLAIKNVLEKKEINCTSDKNEGNIQILPYLPLDAAVDKENIPVIMLNDLDLDLKTTPLVGKGVKKISTHLESKHKKPEENLPQLPRLVLNKTSDVRENQFDKENCPAVFKDKFLELDAKIFSSGDKGVKKIQEHLENKLEGPSQLVLNKAPDIEENSFDDKGNCPAAFINKHLEPNLKTVSDNVISETTSILVNCIKNEVENNLNVYENSSLLTSVKIPQLPSVDKETVTTVETNEIIVQHSDKGNSDQTALSRKTRGKKLKNSKSIDAKKGTTHLAVEKVQLKQYVETNLPSVHVREFNEIECRNMEVVNTDNIENTKVPSKPPEECSKDENKTACKEKVSTHVAVKMESLTVNLATETLTKVENNKETEQIALTTERNKFQCNEEQEVLQRSQNLFRTFTVQSNKSATENVASKDNYVENERRKTYLVSESDELNGHLESCCSKRDLQKVVEHHKELIEPIEIVVQEANIFENSTSITEALENTSMPSMNASTTSTTSASSETDGSTSNDLALVLSKIVEYRNVIKEREKKFKQSIAKCEARRAEVEDKFNYNVKLSEQLKALIKARSKDQPVNFLEKFNAAKEEYYKSKQVSRAEKDSLEDTDQEIDQNDIVATKSLYEKVCELFKKPDRRFRFYAPISTGEYYYFDALYESVPFKTHVNLETEVVHNLEVFWNLEDNAPNIQKYDAKILENRLTREHLLASLGSHYDLLTLLDYVSIVIDDILTFLGHYLDLQRSKHQLHVEMDSDFNICFHVLKPEKMIYWKFALKMTPTNVGVYENLSVHSVMGLEVDVKEIETIAERTLKGSNFLKNFIENIESYVESKNEIKF